MTAGSQKQCDMQVTCRSVFVLRAGPVVVLFMQDLPSKSNSNTSQVETTQRYKILPNKTEKTP
eukprot:5785831-Amphidinium_carterae.1